MNSSSDKNEIENFSSTTFLENLKNEKIEKHDFWRTIEKFYKKNDITDITLFVSCFSVINELFKNDYAGSRFYTWLEEYCQSNPKKGIKIKTEIENNPSSDSYEFWASVVFGLNKKGKDFEDEIIKNIKSEEVYKISAGLRTATIIKSKDKQALCKQINRLIDLKKFKEIFDDVHWAYLTNFYIHSLEKFPDFENNILDLFTIESVYIRSSIVNAINLEKITEENQKLFYPTIDYLIKTPLEYSGIYNSINFTLDKFLEEKPEILKYFFENWIEAHLPSAKNMNSLENLINTFIEKKPNYFYNLISHWLLKSYKYGLAVQYIISEINSDRNLVRLDEEWLTKLKEEDSILLGYRIVGFAWDKDVAYTMMLQLLRVNVNSQEIINNTANLIYLDLILNYPSLIEKMKNEKTSDKKYKSILTQIADKADEYFKKLSNLKVLEEFKPSEKRLEYYNKIQFSGVSDENFENKKTTFLDFVDKTQLRAGKGFFTKIDNNFNENSFTDAMEMKRISHSFEMPRLEFIDPIGQQAKRLHYIHITKDELRNS